MPASSPANPYRSLVSAVRAGDEEAVRRLLAEGVSPDKPGVHTNDGWLPLATAIDIRSPSLVRLLLDAGASPSPPPDPEASTYIQAGPFQAAIAVSDLKVFRELVARCPQALDPEFRPAGMKADSTTGNRPTLWQALVAKHQPWLVELIEARRAALPEAPVSPAVAVSVIRDSTAVRLGTLTALAGITSDPLTFAEDVAAHATYSAYLKVTIGSIQSGDFAQSVGKWALEQGATLEGRRQKGHSAQKSRPSTALAHLAGADSKSKQGLRAWVEKRAAVCPLAELDTALRTALSHTQPEAYALLVAARARRPDAASPLTPEAQSMPPGPLPLKRPWLQTAFARLLENADSFPRRREMAQDFLKAFRAHPIAITEPGARPYAALLGTAGGSPTGLSPEQEPVAEALCIDWLAAGIVPDDAERALMTQVSPRIRALVEDYELRRDLPSGSEPSARRLRL